MFYFSGDQHAIDERISEMFSSETRRKEKKPEQQNVDEGDDGEGLLFVHKQYIFYCRIARR
jgi:hypothetical protein